MTTGTLGSRIEYAYRDRHNDPSFADILRECCNGEPSDDVLAELIESDGRCRLRKGRSVTLERYLDSVEDLLSRPDVLDAALEVTLRSMSGSARISRRAADELSARFPELNQAIREAAALNAALWSTSGLRERMTPPPSLRLPCNFGPAMSSGQRRYILRELIGQGSFGQVYRAEDRQLSEEGHAAIVAIKILASAPHSDHVRALMIEEATKSRRIRHPNVVQVLDRGVSDNDEDFIIYEYIEGGDLASRSAAALPMPPQQAARLVAQIARGVHAAHAAGVIHCDLKPSNIMLTADGQPKVADFGIAVRVGDLRVGDDAAGQRGREPIGNIAFISPEQFRNESRGFSVLSDVYALGGILYFLLTGDLPNGSTREEITRVHDVAQRRQQPPSPRQARPSIDEDLDAICVRALSPEPESRPESSAAFAEDLERWLAREPIPWRRPSLVRRTALWSRRKPALAATAAMTIVVAMVGGSIALYFARQSQRNATKAQLNAAEAERKSLEARLAQVEVEKAAAIEAERRRLLVVISGALRNIQNDQRFLTDMLMQVWVFEFLYGPTALGDPLKAQQLWDSRLDAVRTMLAESDSAGTGDTLESTLWRHTLAFWLVSINQHAEATKQIDRVQAALQNMLPPDDPWLKDLHALRLCAEVSRAATKDQRSSSPFDDVSLAKLHDSLEAELERVSASRARSPLHYLVLNRLADLNEPALLNRPDQAIQRRTEVATLLDATQNQDRASNSN